MLLASEDNPNSKMANAPMVISPQDAKGILVRLLTRAKVADAGSPPSRAKAAIWLEVLNSKDEPPSAIVPMLDIKKAQASLVPQSSINNEYIGNPLAIVSSLWVVSKVRVTHVGSDALAAVSRMQNAMMTETTRPRPADAA